MNRLSIIWIILLIGIIFALPQTTQASREKGQRIEKCLQRATTKFLYSLNQGICANVILNSTIRQQYISSTLTGRVQPVGTFLTTDLAIEYLYGILCAIPNLPPRRELLDSADLLQWTYDPNYYRVSFKIRVNLKSSKKLVFFGLLAFDRNFKLCGYEAVIQNAGLALDIPLNLHSFAIQGLCQAIQVVCPVGSPLQQYTDINECITFLSEPTTSFGTYDRADQNNVVCRLIHIQLAQIAPSIHCPHVGKTGGGACVDKTADSYFQGTSDFLQCAHRYRKTHSN